jgi:hypothetical protein
MKRFVHRAGLQALQTLGADQSTEVAAEFFVEHRAIFGKGLHSVAQRPDGMGWLVPNHTEQSVACIATCATTQFATK